MLLPLTRSRTVRRLMVFVLLALFAYFSDRGNKTAECATCKVFSPPVFRAYPDLVPLQVNSRQRRSQR